MAPSVSGTKKNIGEIKNFNKNLKNEKKKLLQLRKFVENNFEFVGENFSNKVREVYYDKKNKKITYRTTTLEETKE